jgi:hypothetical protein
MSAGIFIVSFIESYAGVLSTLTAFFWGAASMTMYAICLAHANDNADSADFVDIGSAMLITYGVSSAIGAPVASVAMAKLGHHYFFVYMVVMFALFMLFLFQRRQSHVLPAVAEDNEAFQAVAGMTTPAAFTMDPRSEQVDEIATEEEFEREWADVEGDYHEFLDDETATPTSDVPPSEEEQDDKPK